MKISGIQRILALIVVCAPAACQREQRAAGTMPQHVYVWQRVWNSAVRDGLRESSPAFGEIVVLTAQISLIGQRNVTRVEPDFAALLSTGKPVGLAIRISPFPGPFTADDDQTRAILALVRERLAHARKAGIEPAELQIDFDCAESKLKGYRVWLKAIRSAVHPLPVCPTVLPSWLKNRAFADLARDSGRFVLQVHSVSPPRSADDPQPLTDPNRARAWAEQAGKLRVPFRVALPTYTYLAAFDKAGQPLGVSAEGPSSRWPSSARVARWEANPAHLAELVAAWTRSRPATMTGVIWYRLPIATDTLNWRWITLSAVMKGEAPRRSLRLEATGTEPADLMVINDGEQDEPLPTHIDAQWSDAQLSAADALGGYALESTSEQRANSRRFHQTARASLSRLRPGERHPIGWIRCEPPVPIRLSIPHVAKPGDNAQPASAARDGL